MSANLSKRLQALEALRLPCLEAENAQIDAIMARVFAAVEAFPAAIGDVRTPRQRLEDALLSETESAEDEAMLDALMDPLMDAVQSVGMTPAQWYSL